MTTRANSDTRCFEVVFYRRVADENCTWRDSSDWRAVAEMLDELKLELARFNIEFCQFEEENEIIVRGYTDVLNSIRLRYPPAGFNNTCLGHVLGRSADRDLAADLKRGINRVLFAPETIEPQGSDKVVCHNCGCGC